MENQSTQSFVISPSEVEETFVMNNSKSITQDPLLMVTLAIFVAGVLLNWAMILQQCCFLRRMSPSTGHMKKVNSVLLLNLAGSQFMSSFWITLVDALGMYYTYWYAGRGFCKVVAFLWNLFVTSTVYSLTANLVAHVVHTHSAKITGAALTYLRFILPVWALSILCNVPVLYQADTEQHYFLGGVEYCDFCGDASVLTNYCIRFKLILNFGLPLVVTTVFIVLGIVLSKKVSSNQSGEDTDLREWHRGCRALRSRANIHREHPQHTITPPLLSLLCFAFWIPFYVTYGYGVFFDRYYTSAMNNKYPWFFTFAELANPCSALCCIICTKLNA